MTLSTINWKIWILIIWGIFSLAYISYDTFANFKNIVLQNAYMSGQSDTIAKLMEQASNQECKPFNVFLGEKKVDLINIVCLQKPAADNNNTNTTPGNPQK